MFSGFVNATMKGRIRCPNCSNEFVADAIEGTDELQVSCPACNHSFTVQTASCEKTKDEHECTWEEHGEPRKTILSSIKPRTDKPMIAAMLLLVVVLVGIIASITPGLFLQTPVMIFSNAGMDGSIIIDTSDMNSQFDLNETFLTIESCNCILLGKLDNDSIIFDNLPLGENNADFIIGHLDSDNHSSFEVFVIPFFINSYKLSIDDVDSLVVTPNGYAWLSGILIIFSVVCLIGLLSSWRRMYSDVALIGSIVGIFTIGFFLINVVLGAIACYLIWKSRDEFDDGKKGKNF